MKTDTLQQYVELHRELTEERVNIQDRLRQINEALGQLSPVSLSAAQGAAAAPAPAVATQKRGGKRTMSPAARARIAAAQRARWAASRGEQAKVAPAPADASGGVAAKPKRKMSPAGRRAIAEAARRRWAAARAAGKTSL
jgi:hypothetical protein